MNRRQHIKKTTFAGIAIFIPKFISRPTDLIIGHNGFKYKVDTNWGNLDPLKVPVTDCHEMVQDKKGRIILLTNNVKNNLIYYNTSGKLLKTVQHDFPGAHGLTLSDEGGDEFLYVTDTNKNTVYKLSIEGKLVMALSFPQDSGKYKSESEYMPTETAISSNGDIYVADGYGNQNIVHYDSKGNIKNIFGGRGEGDDQFLNAHGIAIDSRDGHEKLLITARMKNELKYFDLNGNYKSTIKLPGAFICRPVVNKDNVYLATIWTNKGESNSGVITILDSKNQVVSQPGAVKPEYNYNILSSSRQGIQLFKHPHDICVDKDENLYVAQWNAGKVYPYKLIRI